MLRIAYTPNGFDLVKGTGRLEVDDGLETPVVLSLFSDAPATADELAAAGLTREQNRGAYWGNDYPDVDGDIVGSKLWLLARANRSDASLAQARDYAAEAVAWMIEDGLATRIPFTSGWYQRTGFLILGAEMYRPGDLRPRWRRVWNAQSGQVIEAA